MLQASNVKLQYKNQFTNINIYNLKKKKKPTLYSALSKWS